MPPRTRARQTTRAPKEAPPRNDVYVGLLVIAFLAMVAGTTLLAMDYSAYPSQKPTEVQLRQPPQAGANQPQPPGGGGVQPPGGGGVQPPGGGGVQPPGGGMPPMMP